MLITVEQLIEALEAVADSIDHGTSEAVRIHTHELQDELEEAEHRKEDATAALITHIKEATGCDTVTAQVALEHTAGDAEQAVQYMRMHR